MKNLQEGMFVRLWPDGDVGMIVKMDKVRPGVRFVNNGPIYSYPKEKLIPATRKQIKAAGLHGVGCVEPPE